jgi:hypothetical protein
MKLFRCQACDNLVYFENRTCGRCGHRLGYIPELEIIAAVEPAGEPNWTPLKADGAARRFCANADHDVCNWMLPPGSAGELCVACRHNDTIPDLSNPAHVASWRELELAKHRLFYSLLRWRLPLKTRAEDSRHGLAFEFLADPPQGSGVKVMTGHDEGIVTIALTEADSAERERRRSQLDEPYRSVLGHFRHEIGHHYWDVLVRDGGRLEACRAVFGDDTQDYGEALKRHYSEGAPPNWQESFVSAYATSHPWEDFAETWAHYFHIVDTLEMASAFDMSIEPIDTDGAYTARLDFDPYVEGTIEDIIDAWAPFVLAMNSINRAMGRPDLYPFVLAPAVVEKLRFISRPRAARAGEERESRGSATSGPCASHKRASLPEEVGLTFLSPALQGKKPRRRDGPARPDVSVFAILGVEQPRIDLRKPTSRAPCR